MLVGHQRSLRVCATHKRIILEELPLCPEGESEDEWLGELREVVRCRTRAHQDLELVASVGADTLGQAG
jgi:hypothetical protein